MSSRKLAFSDDDMKRYGRVDIAARDLHDAKAYGAFILKKGWKAKSWSRGSTYLQQSAFVTSMIVSYARHAPSDAKEQVASHNRRPCFIPIGAF